MDIGTVIKGMRKGMGQSQSAFAEAVGMTQTNLSFLEQNKTFPTMTTLKNISEHTGVAVPMMFLFAVQEEDVPKENLEKFKTSWPAVIQTAEKIFELTK